MTPDTIPFGQSSHAHSWNKRDWAICILLGVIGLLLFCTGRNQEFQGDDDYLYAANFASISDALLGLDVSSLTRLGSSFQNLAGQIICAPRHAPLPACIHAGWYALCHLLHIPFTVNLLQFPTAAGGSVTLILLYGLLRQNRERGRSACATSVLLLLLSPIFVMTSRGLATYFLTAIPLVTLMVLWALNRLGDSATPRWWIGFSLALVVLADPIWFVTLPVLSLAFLWAAKDRKQAFQRLVSPSVLAPLATTVLLLLAGTWVAYHKGIATPLSKLLMEHGTKVIQGSPVITSPVYLAECLSVLLGVALPGLLPLGLILWWVTGKPRTPDLVTAFGLTGILIYGAIFYGLTPERTFVKLCYQTYLLLPFLLIVVALLDRLRSSFPRGPAWAAIVLGLLLVFEGLGCVNFVWKLPVSPASRVFSEWAHGTASPNRGTKAAGYLARQWIEAVWRQNPKQPITLYAAKYNTSFAIFSGLNAGEKGWTFIPEFGPDRPITAMSAPVLETLASKSASGPPAMVYLFDFAAESIPTTLNLTPLIENQPSLLSYTIRSSSPANGLALVFVRPPRGIATPPVTPGEISMEDCESHFDKTYTHYYDFFPRRFAP
jgi:hypothetical protein